MAKRAFRAFLLSMDAFVAVGLLLLLTAFMSGISVSYSSPEIEYQRFYYVGRDVISTLEKAKLTAVIEFMPENFTADCNMSDADMDKSILDALGFLWAQNSTSLNECALNLTKELLDRTIPVKYGYEVLIDGTEIYKKGTEGSYLSRLHTIVSGYELGKPVSGYFASAYVSRMAKETFSYFDFGGYVGDGNITRNVFLPSDANVTYAYMEANMGSNFTLYMNGILVGQFNKTKTNLTASNWTLCTDYTDCHVYFKQGNNTMTLNFSRFENNFVGGGFLKVHFNTSKPDTRGIFSVSNETVLDNYWFPGILGIINIYSGFYVPGTLNNMSLRIHYDNNITINDSGLPTFLIIGNSEIFRSNASGENTVDMNDSVLRSMLNYDSISNSTVPIRLGMETFMVIGGVGSSNVVLITDRSGSMGTCDVWSNSSWDCLPGSCNDVCSSSCDDDNSTCEGVCNGAWTEVTPGVYSCVGVAARCCDSQALCTQCGGLWGRRERINVAKDSDHKFIDSVLGFKGNMAGLTGYGTDLCSYEELTSNQTLLDDKVNTYADDCSGTCICCGINKALDLIMKGKYLNALENSRFTGPSIDKWNVSGVVNLSDDISGTDTLAFGSPDNILDPDMIQVTGNMLAIAYEKSGDDDGWLATVQVNGDGTMSGPVDSYEYDNDRGENPDIIHVSGDVYAIAY
ncbi:MAG: hypothetical protein JXC85_04755, partial [Candidatus Aenigmarchaeota archaeon]|nr:hypothetical protein [Candidatus Aenigmarchaeota archaeon]